MFGIIDPLTYLLGTIAIVLLPGPNSLFCLAVAGQYGVAAGYRVAAAIFIGDGLLMLATALGAATFLKANPQWFDLLRLAGALYLAFLGIKLLFSAKQLWGQKPTKAKRITRPQRVFSKALTLSLTNPKAILFFLSFFVQFVDPDYPHPLLSFLILAVMLQICSLTYLSILIFGGSRLAQHFRQHYRAGAATIAAIGVLFIGFAVRLWQTNLQT